MAAQFPEHPHVELVPPALLKPNSTNARTHSERQIRQIAASIEKFGFLVPIIIDEDNKIAAGHGRWQASTALDLSLVPIIRARFLTEADRRAFTLAENRIAQLSGWDDARLTEELTFLFEAGQLEITGFSTSDLDFAIGEEVPKAEPEVVEIPDPGQQAVSRLGDLWHIGPHRLLCGDARFAESYEALLDDERAAMIVADPPYNVPIDGHVSGNGKVRHREFVMGAGEMTAPEFTAFLRAVFRILRDKFSQTRLQDKTLVEALIIIAFEPSQDIALVREESSALDFEPIKGKPLEPDHRISA